MVFPFLFCNTQDLATSSFSNFWDCPFSNCDNVNLNLQGSGDLHICCGQMNRNIPWVLPFH